MPSSRYKTAFGRRYILIRRRTLLPAVIVDLIGFALRRLLPRARPEGVVRRILAIRLDHIGDVLITTPALRLLREMHPEARLDVLAGSWSADLLEDDPDVDRVITFDARWFGGRSSWRLLRELLSRLRRERYDLVVDFRGDLRHLLMARWIGAKRVHGHGIRGGGFLLTEQTPYDEGAHEVDRALAIVRGMHPGRHDAGGLQVFLSEEDRVEAARLFEEIGVDQRRPVIGLCPSSRNPSRMWQLDRFAQVARHLVTRYGAEVVVFGESAEPAEGILAAGIPGVRSLLGRTTLRVFAAALARVDLIVSVESSPIHFASALQKPIVTVFGGSSLPEHWGPYGTRHRIVHRAVACSPCHQLRCPLPEVLCMGEITATDVEQACDDLIAELELSSPAFAAKLGAVQHRVSGD